MNNLNNSEVVSPGASSHVKRSDCQCTHADVSYDAPGGSIDSYDHAYTCTVCEKAYRMDIVTRYGSIAAMEHECGYYVYVEQEAHFYLNTRYSIQCNYRMPSPACLYIDHAHVPYEDDLPF